MTDRDLFVEAYLDRLALISAGEVPATAEEVRAEQDPIRQELLAALFTLHEDLGARAELRRELAEAHERRAVAEVEARAADAHAATLHSTLDELERAHQDLQRAQERLAARSRLAAMGELATGVAHDINNMLTVLMAIASAMEHQIDPSHPLREAVDELSSVLQGSQRMSRQLLEFGRTTSDEVRAPPEQVELASVVGDNASLLARTAGEAMALVVERAAAPTPVRVDVGALERVLLNLVCNARDALEDRPPRGPEGPTIMIRTRRRDDRVRLEVEDNGGGMPPDVQRRAFEPLFTTKARGRGSGMGLASAYAIVKRARGTIRIESEPGRGCRIVIELPAAP